ncbi:1-acyl-sn-glycerol-3-phosphate acyltransferase [soil metagenome]
MNRLIAAIMPWVIERSLRRGLMGVWARVDGGAAPAGGAVVVANHGSWWDGYLLWLMVRRARRPLGILIDAPTLERFPFFRQLGGLAPAEARAAARRARTGAWVVVFPEGEIVPSGTIGSFAPGARAISRWADVPIIPVAIRVVLRARQRPEAYLRIGEPLGAGTAERAQRDRVTSLLTDLDGALEAADHVEAPPAGFDLWLHGVRSTDERAAELRRWWT